MNESRRLRPDRPNPLRYQGGLQHYHVSPRRQNVSWEQWVGEKLGSRRRWFWFMTVATVVAIASVTAALWH